MAGNRPIRVAHEIGHFLDYSGIGTKNQFASETEAIMQVAPAPSLGEKARKSWSVMTRPNR